ncbi:MAG: Uma2 family endonuclease [Halothece sp. Uz-M2-17]|mgnify:CR=1 FL=1|nr:Uma2 family endonuclease [Halothece sp. Uz-M2-17]
MVTAKDHFLQLTPEEYFDWEEKQVEKYEYINGQVYAMGGGSVNHGRIAIRLTAMFDAHLEGSGCITGNSDIKINIAETDNYTYPDASVTCDERDKNTPSYLTYPCLIVEVLSKSTEAYDRGGKFRLYRNNPALQDYLLVSSTRMEIDLYHKKGTGEWIIVNYQEGDRINLNSINLSFEIEQVYRGLSLTPES